MRFTLAFFVIVFLFIGCSSAPKYEISEWKTLIDPAFDQEKVVAHYKQKVAQYAEGSEEEKAIYAQMQEALKNAGNNKAADNKTVKLSGYIVPLDIDGDKVSRFLFFPNAAACIHVPSSPANQTILVEVKEGEGVLLEDAYERVTVYGMLHLERHEEATGTASFVIRDAVTMVTPEL
jgi:hypothetical protein